MLLNLGALLEFCNFDIGSTVNYYGGDGDLIRWFDSYCSMLGNYPIENSDLNLNWKRPTLLD